MSDLSFLSVLSKQKLFNEKDIKKIRRQIISSESYYMPLAKIAYFGNTSVYHISEEATHFLRHVCAGDLFQDPQLLVDAFYDRCIEEAIGFLGSKIINHKRKCTS